MANRIFISGDTHGLLDAGKLINLSEKEKLDYKDYLIICGDCGVVWDKDLLDAHIEVYENLNTNVMFIDGNHENFDMLNEYKVEIWAGGKIHKISDHITHLMRGQVFEILGKTFFCLGGANSTDKAYRTEHISWWNDEEITHTNLQESLENLSKHNFKVDYVLTHCPPNKIITKIAEIFTQCGESVPYFLEKKLKHTSSGEILDILQQKIDFKKWFFGHLHIDEYMLKHNALFENIIKL